MAWKKEEQEVRLWMSQVWVHFMEFQALACIRPVKELWKCWRNAWLLNLDLTRYVINRVWNKKNLFLIGTYVCICLDSFTIIKLQVFGTQLDIFFINFTQSVSYTGKILYYSFFPFSFFSQLRKNDAWTGSYSCELGVITGCRPG